MQGRPFLRLWFLVVLGSLIGAEERRPNVLFISIDDLRPQLGCYGEALMRTPNIDRLAAEGTLFERAYCMVPCCGASRAALMTGLRPTANRFLRYDCWAERDAPGVLTLNSHFLSHGYRTLSVGKVFHHLQDNAQGWSEPAWSPQGGGWPYLLPENQALHPLSPSKPPGRRTLPLFEAADVADEAYQDGRVKDRAIEDLRRLALGEEPFFLAVGFYKPHLPFVAPKRYWDLYDPEEILLPATFHATEGLPPEALNRWMELRSYVGIPIRGAVSDEMARSLIHGYYACVSYADALVGRLLDELERLELSDRTIVVLWGDHGWNLGEHSLWCKESCFESTMRAPLIVRAPGAEGGQRTRALVEFIDVYPTLCELTGLPLPDHLDGLSFKPLLADPELRWKESAIGRYLGGETIRTDTHRFTEFSDASGASIARMLFSHERDSAEERNLSELEESRELVRELRKRLQEGIRSANPDPAPEDGPH